MEIGAVVNSYISETAPPRPAALQVGCLRYCSSGAAYHNQYVAQDMVGNASAPDDYTTGDQVQLMPRTHGNTAVGNSTDRFAKSETMK
jgi:hypothetical protein